MESTGTIPLYLTDEIIRDKKLLQLDKLVPAIENALVAVSKNNDEVIQPLRSVMKITSRNGAFLSMSAFSEADDALACKLATVYPDNVTKGLPSILCTVVLLDSATGKVSAIMDGNDITTWRTPAASVVATKYLHNGTTVLAILGSGIQGRSHALTLDHFFHFKQIRIWNHRFEGAQKLTEELKEKGKTVTAYKKAEECVKGADVIVTATYATSPILKGKWVKPGAHINAIGVGENHHSELDMELYKTSDVYTDTMAAGVTELKGLIDAGVKITEVGEVINGTKPAIKTNTTIFQSLGMAVEDVMSAKLIYDEYKKITE